MLRFSLDLDIMRFGTRRRILDFCLVLFHLSGKPWVKGGVLIRDVARWCPYCSVLEDSGMWPVARGPHWPPLPPPPSPDPIGLACPHGKVEGLAPVLGIGFRLWQSALGFFLLSLSCISL